MLNLISTYQLFLIPVFTIIISQLVKIAAEAFKGNFSWKNFNKYGGMPSSHSAFVASLLTTLGHTQGVNSPSFAVSFVLAALVIRDAIGLRDYLSNHSKVINLLIEKLPDDLESEFPHIEERLGHTPAQVVVGLLFGFIISLILLKLL
jgi:hypothetical protein